MKALLHILLVTLLLAGAISSTFACELGHDSPQISETTSLSAHADAGHCGATSDGDCPACRVGCCHAGLTAPAALSLPAPSSAQAAPHAVATSPYSASLKSRLRPPRA